MADDGILGLLGRFGDPAALYGGALTDPATKQAMVGRGLLAMAGSFADSAMPTRMPTPIGAVLGHAAGALGTSQDAIMQARLQAAQSEQALGQSQLTKAKAGLIGTIGADQAAYNAMDSDGIPSPPAPGTIGTPAVPTASVNTGRGPSGVIIPPGTPTATHDPKLSGTDNLTNLAYAAAPIALPPGYTVEIQSGNRPGATVAGTGGPSQHAGANAVDILIKRPDGTPIDNEGPDTTGNYAKLAVTMRAIASPDIKPWLAWGGNFGKTDVMHYDFAGDRGTAGSLAAMEKNLLAPPKPVQVAQANTGTMTDAVPPGMAAATAGPVQPPGLLGPSGQTIDQLANQAMAARPPVSGAAPGPGPGPAPGAPAGLLGISPETIATFKAAGMTDAEIARITAAPSGPPPGPPSSVAPPGPVVSPSAAVAPSGPPLGPPPQAAAGPRSLVTAPPPAAQAAPVPPITQPQVAAAPPPAAAAATTPGAPSPAKIAAAQRLAAKYSAAGLAVPADVEATAKFGLTVAQAAATAAATAPSEIAKAIAIAKGTSPIEVQKAIDIANGTLAAKIAEAQAGPRESGAQARQTAAEALGNEYVNYPSLGGWIQRKNIPGFSTTVGASGAAAPRPAPAAGTGTGGGAVAGTGSPVVTGQVSGAIPDTTPAQQKIFEDTLGQANKQLEPLHIERQNAGLQIGRADEINDLLKRTTLGWGAETKQQGAMILKGLGVSDERVKQFLGNVDTTAGGALNKLFLNFSADAVRSLGANQAASVVGRFADAYPSLESDPRAAELMTNAIRMQAKWQEDRANAADAWNAEQKQKAGTFGQNYKGLTGFYESFAKTNDFNDYWRASLAMSGFSDLAWRGTSEAQQTRIHALIPPGRWWVGGNGKWYPNPGAQ